MYQQSVPAFQKYLANLSAILKKAEAYCVEKKIDGSVLLNDRLYPDMFDLKRQVQIACDFAKNTCGRISGTDLPKFEDNEKTFEELYARIQKTLDYIGGINPAAFDGAENRTVTFPIRGEAMTFQNVQYLFHFALPNFYFHCTTAYAILRNRGVVVGKGDFVGSFTN